MSTNAEGKMMSDELALMEIMQEYQQQVIRNPLKALVLLKAKRELTRLLAIKAAAASVLRQVELDGLRVMDAGSKMRIDDLATALNESEQS